MFRVAGASSVDNELWFPVGLCRPQDQGSCRVLLNLLKDREVKHFLTSCPKIQPPKKEERQEDNMRWLVYVESGKSRGFPPQGMRDTE